MKLIEHYLSHRYLSKKNGKQLLQFHFYAALAKSINGNRKTEEWKCT